MTEYDEYAAISRGIILRNDVGQAPPVSPQLAELRAQSAIGLSKFSGQNHALFSVIDRGWCDAAGIQWVLFQN